jgi:hypothetical protein
VTAADSRRFFQSHGRLETIKLALAFFAIYFIWGSTYLAIRYAVETAPPLLTAAIRHTVAGSLLLRLDLCVYLVYVATAALPSCLGCDAHLCQSAGSYASRLAGRVGALDHSRRDGFGRDSGSHRASSQGRAQLCSTEPVRVEGAVVIQFALDSVSTVLCRIILRQAEDNVMDMHRNRWLAGRRSPPKCGLSLGSTGSPRAARQAGRRPRALARGANRHASKSPGPADPAALQTLAT